MSTHQYKPGDLVVWFDERDPDNAAKWDLVRIIRHDKPWRLRPGYILCELIVLSADTYTMYVEHDQLTVKISNTKPWLFKQEEFMQEEFMLLQNMINI